MKLSPNTHLDRWLETAVKPRVGERTYRDYIRKAGRYLRPELGARLSSSIKPYDIQALHAKMLKGGLSSKAVRHVQTIIHNAFEQAIR